jgi:predicted ATPase/signal transduction histidine kinase
MPLSQSNVIVPGYEILSEIAKTDRHIIYRAKSAKTLQQCVIKTHIFELPTARQKESLLQEFTLLQSLAALPSVAKCVEFVTLGPRCFSVYLDHGIPASKRFEEHSFKSYDHPIFLEVAIQLAETLSELHKLKIVHRDIKPSNILLNSQNKATLIDFELASCFKNENLPFLGPLSINGSLEYISPEQTGRINRPVDYRTDLYSLGITLYLLATGAHPFKAEDRLGWIYQHIAVEPLSPNKSNGNIPAPLSDMILKLLSKETDDRYQNASTLVHDLKTLQKTQVHKRNETFLIGKNDRPPFLQNSKKIYGREAQISQIKSALNSAQNGPSEFIFVTGRSGLGKTALVHEVHRTLSVKNGLYLEGKFDQNQRNVPLSAFVSILDQALLALTFDSPHRQSDWVQSLVNDPQFNAAVLIELIPDAAKVFGKLSLPSSLGVMENQNRLVFTLGQFLRALAGPNRPLVIFVDDLQWADQLSLEIVENLFAHRNQGHLLFIGAYRDNELGASLRLSKLMNDMSGAGELTKIEIPFLTLSNVQEMLTDTLELDQNEVFALAQNINVRTLGNAFYVIRFLRDLISDNVFEFNQTQGRWTWDLARINDAPTHLDVADYLVSRMSFLHEDCVKVFEGLSLMGQKASESALYSATDTNPENFHNGLRLLLEGGCIICQESTEKTEYKFCHDQLQRASYRMIPQTELQHRHLRLALILDEKNIEEFAHKSDLFALADQYICAYGASVTFDQKIRSEHVLFKATEEAWQSASYESVRRYGNGLFRSLGPNKWSHYNITMRVSELLAQSLFLLKSFDESQKVSHEMLAHANCAIDKAKVFNRQSELQAFATEFKKSYASGRTALSYLKIWLPKRLTKFHTLFSAFRVYLILRGKDLSKFPVLEKETDESKILALSLLNNLRFFVYIPYGPMASVTVGLITISSYFRRAASEELAGALSFLAEILANHFGKLKYALELNAYVSRMMKSLNASEFNSKITFGAAEGVMCLEKSFAELANIHIKSHLNGVEQGDLFYSSYSLTVATYAECFAGLTLAKIRDSAKSRESWLVSLKQFDLAHSKKFFTETLWSLLHKPLGNEHLLALNNTAIPLVHVRAMNLSAACFFLVVLGRLSEAKVVLAEISKFDRLGLMNQLFCREVEFLECYLSFVEDEPIKLKKLKTRISKINAYAEINPANFICHSLMIEGIQMSKAGRCDKALSSFQKCLNAAVQSGLTQWRALAHLNLSQVFQKLSLESESTHHLRQWSDFVFAWIGDSAVKFLLGPSGEVFETRQTQTQVSATDSSGSQNRDFKPSEGSSSPFLGQMTTSHNDASIDYETLSKAALSVASVIETDALISALVSLIKENVCADVVTVFLRSSEDPSVDLKPVGNAKSGFVSACVSEVIKNSQMIFSDHAQLDPRFKDDPCVIEHGVKSLLGIPLLSQGKILGVILLENRLTSGAFTAERRQLALFIASQAGAALQNAQLYGALKELNEKLEATVLERTSHLISAQQELLALSRHAGASQVVTSVLHNIGNILNSLATSVSHLKGLIDAAPFSKLGRALELANSQGIDLDRFLTEDPRGKKLATYLVELGKMIFAGHRDWKLEITTIEQATIHIKEIIGAQQSLSVLKSFEEVSDLGQLIKTCLSLQSESLSRHQIKADLECDDELLKTLRVDRNRLMQVLINLLTNAKESITESEGGSRFIFITAQIEFGSACIITIKDSGTGLSADQISKLFQFGFTTKRAGHGFGLHHCANTIKEMGGTIEFWNNIGEPGATFSLKLPLGGSRFQITKDEK